MDDTPDLDIGCQEITVKYKRKKKREIRSKKFKKILDILRSGKERHIIQYTNKEKTEFEVKYVDKKNKKVWNERDISLFLALDAVSPKPRDQKNLAEETKNRFKSNMSKFVKAGYLKYLDPPRKISKTVVYKKYRILKDFPIGDETEEGCSPQSTGTQSRGSSEDRSHSMGSSSNSSCSFPSTSHYLCLSEKLLESDEYEMRADGNEESINNLPVANEVAAKDYIASETLNLSIGTQYVNRPNWNSGIVSYGNEGSINIVPVVGEEMDLNFPVVMKYGNEPNSEEYQNIPNENEESVNILHEANGAVVAKDYIAGESSDLSIGMQYVNKSNWNSEIVSYGNEGSMNIVPVVGEEIEVKGCIADEDLNFPVGMKYGNETNSEEYRNIPNENEESVNILHEANGAVVAKDYIAGETSDLSIGMQYVNKSNWNNEEYRNIPNGREESVNILQEANSNEYENIPYKNEESVNILLVLNVVAKGYISDEASIGMQYVNKPNWNSNEYEIIPDGNEKSSNNLPVMNEESVAKDDIAHETSNLSIGTQYVNKSNWNSEIVSYGNEGSMNIVPVVGEEMEVRGCIADEDLNFPVVMKYGNESNSEEYQNIPNENEESVNILHEANGAVAAKDYRAGEAWNRSIEMQYVNKPNWNESNFDDATLFEEMEHDGEILKDSTNPLLSSAVVSEQNTGWIPDSVWQTEYKMFSFDEDMYDSS